MDCGCFILLITKETPQKKDPFDRLRANGSHLKIITVSSVHAEHVEAQ
jgi:hypothetical protein